MSQPERDDSDSLARMFEAIRRGDRDGFERLLGKYRPLIGEMVNRMMRSKLRSVLEVDDVVQDVSLSAYRGMAEAEFSGMAGFSAWLKKLTANRLIDLDRRHNKAARRPTDVRSLEERPDGKDAPKLIDLLAGTGPGPSTVFGRQEMAIRLHRALSSLRAVDREILTQVFVENLLIREIAVRQGKLPAAVSKALSRALEACRREFLRSAPPHHGGDA